MKRKKRKQNKLDCKHCDSPLKEGGEAIVLCEYKNGFVHKPCCDDSCNQGGFCEHRVAEYHLKL